MRVKLSILVDLELDHVSHSLSFVFAHLDPALFVRAGRFGLLGVAVPKLPMGISSSPLPLLILHDKHWLPLFLLDSALLRNAPVPGADLTILLSSGLFQIFDCSVAYSSAPLECSLLRNHLSEVFRGRI